MKHGEFPYDALYYPEKFLNIKEDLTKRTYAICHQSLSRYWHRLYDNSDILLNYVDLHANSTDILNKFLNWVFINRFIIDWRFSIFFAAWAELHYEECLKHDGVLEQLLSDAVMRWSLSDKSFNRVIVISWVEKLSSAFTSVKPDKIDQFPELMLVELDESSVRGISYGVFKSINDFQINEMQPLI